MGTPSSMSPTTTFLLLNLTIIFTSFLSVAVASNSTSPEIRALLAIKFALSDPRGALEGWDTSTPSAPCDWHGVACSDGRVFELSLNRLSLGGVISERVGELRMLRWLSMHSNALQGAVPASLSQCSLLRAVYLHRNRLAGELPAGIFGLRNLLVLDMADNLISGVVPATLPVSLLELDLSLNRIEGVLPASFPTTLVVANFSFNRFSGNIPASIGHLQDLKYLWLNFNNLYGTLPAAVANCSSLMELRVDSNALRGQIPSTIGQLSKLQLLSLSNNNFSGAVPASVLFIASKLKTAQFGFNAFTDISSPYNSKYVGVLEVLELQQNLIRGGFPKWITSISTLRVLDLSGNLVSGALPVEIGNLVRLVELRLAENELNGIVPIEIQKCSSLQVLDLGNNGFSGPLLASLANLKGLRLLDLGGNQFSGSIPLQFGSLLSLEILDIGENMLVGIVPSELMQLRNLSVLNLSFNKFSDWGGQGLQGIGNLRNLKELNLSGIGLSGRVPNSIGNLMQLVTLDLSKQKLSGSLPIELFGLPGLRIVALEENQLTGTVPESFSSLQSLEHLNLSFNGFRGGISSTFGFLANLVSLSLSTNTVSGVIPAELGNCSSLEVLQLHSNNLTGQIPGELSRLSHLKELDLGSNNLTGEIPDSISGLSNLTALDLSANSLSGHIPLNISSNPSLRYLNVSHNNLEGEIPKPLGYQFNDPSVFSANNKLCGKPLRKECGYVIRRKRKKLIIILSLAAGAAFLVALCCCAYIFNLMRWRNRLRAGVTGEKKRSPRSSGTERGSRGSRANVNGNGLKLTMFSAKITYAEALEATRNFDEENILSRGKYGPVFKASFADGMVLAIRRLTDASITESAFKREAEALGRVKHRNLTVLRGYFAGPPDIRLLVHDYMPNGNLSTLLQEASHQDGHVLNWPMRHLIALGIARGLAFLHSLPIVHGDIKPQIILFDADFEAHISDFGLSRLTLATPIDPSSSSTHIGSLGYISPEAALTGQATLESDVYSFGIVLLEILTGKKPVMFTQDEDIVKWIKRTLQRGQVSELLEPGLLELDPETSEWEEFLLGIKVGLLCTAPDPPERPAMSDIVFMLEGCRVGPDVPSSADPTSPT
ncbi:unnamed protein product [Rhodiola kirilowii]